MKKLLFLLSLILLLCGGCKYFKKSSAKSIDTISADTTTETIDSSAYYNAAADQTSSMVSETAGTSAVNGRFYMVVGCFTVNTNAEKYAEKLRGMGYETQIIPGRDNFQMVTARSYSNYRESVSEIDKFRNDVTPNAWVYRKR
jgi:hypothetical protein